MRNSGVVRRRAPAEVTDAYVSEGPPARDGMNQFNTGGRAGPMCLNGSMYRNSIHLMYR